MVVRVKIREHIGRAPPPWWKRLPNKWPFVIWVVAAVLAGVLYMHGGQTGGMTGSVESDRQVVAPLEAGRVKAVYVEIGQEVRKGDLVAEMDPSVLDAEMAVEQLQAERQFSLVVSRAENDLRSMRIRQAEAQGEVAVLDTEVERLEALLDRHLVDAQTVARMKARQQALKSALALYPEMIEELESQLGDARERQEAMRISLTAGLQEEQLDTVSADRLGLLRLRKQTYRLYAQNDGTVSRILQVAGDVVTAGIPIMTIVGKEVKYVVGFLPEASARDIGVGVPAYVSSTAELGPVKRARVLAVTPDIAALPTRANPIPQRTLRGRRVVLVLEEEHAFFPGESVTIQFQRPMLSLFFDWLGGKGRTAGGTTSEADYSR